MEMDILALALRRAAILNGLLLADHVFIGVVTLDINVATDSQFLTDIARHNADGDQLVLAGGLFAQRIVQRRRNRLFAEALQLIPSPTVALAGGGFCFYTPALTDSHTRFPQFLQQRGCHNVIRHGNPRVAQKIFIHPSNFRVR